MFVYRGLVVTLRQQMMFASNLTEMQRHSFVIRKRGSENYGIIPHPPTVPLLFAHLKHGVTLHGVCFVVASFWDDIEIQSSSRENQPTNWELSRPQGKTTRRVNDGCCPYTKFRFLVLSLGAFRRAERRLAFYVMRCTRDL